MKKMKQLVVAVVLILFAVGILFLPEATKGAVQDALKISVCSVLPSLFPFFVFSNLWIMLGYAQKMSALAAPVMERVFHLPGAAASALILGLIGGYPTGAQTIAGIYKKKLVTKEEAEHMLLFCNNSGPAFAVAVIGGQYFRNAVVGIAIYLVHVCSACLIGILFRRKSYRKTPLVSEQRNVPFLTALTESIRMAGQTAIQVCVFITFFSVLTAMLQSVLPAALQTGDVFRILMGALELVKGSSQVTAWSWPFSVCLAAFYLGWGGMCIHCQSLSILCDTDLTAGKYFMGKLLHGGLSFLMMGCLIHVLPVTRAVWSDGTLWRPFLCQSICLVLAALILMGFLKKTSGNQMKERV